MSFRRRLAFGGLVVAWIPVLGLGLLVRSVGVTRLAEANDRRMRERGDRLAAAWAEEIRELEGRLASLQELLTEDNEARVAVRSERRAGLQPLVARFAASGGVSVTYVLDSTGVILAASHFPGDVGRTEPALGRVADEPELPVVAQVPLPRTDVTALLRGRHIEVGGIRLTGIVGQELPAMGALAAGEELSLFAVAAAEGGMGQEVRPVAGATTASAEGGSFEGRRRIARVQWHGWNREEGTAPVDIVAGWRDPLLPEMIRSFERALLFSLLGSAGLALLLGRVMARRLSLPVAKLAATARRVHLGRLDETFGRGGGKELDRLGFFLNGMMSRLREGVVKDREAEKRATTGELARQINHDMRNGLIPIRNVMSHLQEAHGSGPDALAEAFKARADILTGSLAYLDGLAGRYGAVAARGKSNRSDLRAVIRSVVESGPWPASVRVGAVSGPGPAWVGMDGVSLRRVVENLVTNAVAAAQLGGGGTVRVSARAEKRRERPQYILSVSDDGPGIPPEVRSRMFEPFFTTRREGTGLGLAIARQLVQDVGGELVLESEEGLGTEVLVTLNAIEPKLGKA